MGEFAWVTLATNDSYSLGALVLAHSLKQVKTDHELVVLVTPGVTSTMREKLSSVFNVVQEVNILDSKDEANLRLLNRPELGITFTKLHCWRLTQFKKCVFLDADTLVLQNCDELFTREELSAAPDVGWPDCFNSGVFVYRPSNETYEKLIQFALDKGSFDGGDQGLLNLYFSDWSYKDINKHLPFIYNLCSTACYSYLPAFKQYGVNAKIIHFIGNTKPWLQYFNTETKKVHPSDGLQHLEGVLQNWWNLFCNYVHSMLTKEMTRSTTYNVLHYNFPSFSTSHDFYNLLSNNLNHPYVKINNNKNNNNFDNFRDPWDEYDKKQFKIRHNKNLNYSEDLSVSCIDNSSTINNDNNNNHEIITNNPVEFRDNTLIVENLYEQIIIDNNNGNNNNNNNNKCENIDNINNNNLIIDKINDNVILPSSSSSRPSSPNFIESSLVVNVIPSNFEKNAYVPPNECEVTANNNNETQDIPINDQVGDDTGLAGALSEIKLGVPRTAEQLALDDHLRRQGWEIGNIDYLGKDSFDNIWNKICQTLANVSITEDQSSKDDQLIV